ATDDRRPGLSRAYVNRSKSMTLAGAMDAPRPFLARVRAALGARLWTISRPRIARAVYTNGGLGDELMLTAITRAARLAGRPLHILTERPEVWRDNSDPLGVHTDIDRWWYAHRRGWIRT